MICKQILDKIDKNFRGQSIKHHLCLTTIRGDNETLVNLEDKVSHDTLVSLMINKDKSVNDVITACCAVMIADRDIIEVIERIKLAL